MLSIINEKIKTTLPKHDPSGLPLSSGVKLVENTLVTPIGKGL
jgi:hypothetical protein